MMFSAVPRILALIPFLFLAGCATLQTTSPAEAGWSRVALVILPEDDLRGSKVGTTAFNNAYVDWEVPGLDLVGLLAPIVSSALVEGYGWEVVLRQDWHAELSSEVEDGHHDAFTDYTPSGEVLEEARAEGFDALVVLVPSVSADDLGGTTQGYSGFGIYHRSFLNMTLSFAVAVARLEIHPLRSEEAANRFSNPRFSANRQLDPPLDFKKEWSEYTETEQERIIDAVRQLITKGFAFEVRREILRDAPAVDSPFGEEG